jgi:hypothetical protein
MELRVFIKTVLLDIIHGVEDAQKEAPVGCIAPSNITSNMSAVANKVSHLQPVEFQVAVKADESAKTGAKIGVLGAVFGASATGDLSARNETASIIKFTVPVHLPLGGSKS